MAFAVLYKCLRLLAWPVAIVFLALPKSLRLIRKFSQHIPVSRDAKTSEIASFFSLLLISLLIV